MSSDATERTGLPAADLSTAFGRRSEGLKGLLQPAAEPEPDDARDLDQDQDDPVTPAGAPTPPAPAADPAHQETPGAAATGARPGTKQARTPRTTSRAPRTQPATTTRPERTRTAAPQPEPPTAPAPVQAPSPASEDSDGGRKGLVIYAPLSVRERLTAFRTQHGLTITDVVLDAFDATYDQLPELYAQEAPQERREGSLFDRPASRRKANDDDPLVQIFVSLSAKNRTVINQIAASVAPNNTRARSRICALALQAYLAQQELADHT